MKKLISLTIVLLASVTFAVTRPAPVANDTPNCDDFLNPYIGNIYMLDMPECGVEQTLNAQCAQTVKDCFDIDAGLADRDAADAWEASCEQARQDYITAFGYWSDCIVAGYPTAHCDKRQQEDHEAIDQERATRDADIASTHAAAIAEARANAAEALAECCEDDE